MQTKMAFMCLYCFVSILVGMATNVSAAEISFLDHVTVMEGTDAFFHCSLTLTTDEALTSHGILWTKDDITVIASSDSLVGVGGKYALSGLSTSVSTALSQTMLVSNIVETDLGTYQCIFLQNSQQTNVKASARLYIMDFVPPPMCLDPAETTVSPGDQITLQCIADPGDPAVQMIWSPEAGGGSLANFTQQLNNQLSLDYILTVPDKPDNADGVISYRCETFIISSGNVKSCNISLVVNPIKLLIVQSPEMVTMGQDVNFTCFVLNGLTYSSIAWSFLNSGIHHSIVSSTLTIYDVQSSYDGLIVMCTVSTIDGQQNTATAVLHVVSLPTTSLPTTLAQQTTIPTTHTISQSEVTSKTDVTENKSVSPLIPKDSQSSLNAMFIIIIAACGTILLVLVTCVTVICCQSRQPQAQTSNHDNMNTHMEYYKNVSVEDEIKDNMVVTRMEIEPSNDFADPTYVNCELEGQTENEIYYYKDDGWQPPTTSPQTTIL